MSDVAKMTERMRRPNYGTLEIELTINDPKNYSRPFTVNPNAEHRTRHRAGRRVLPGEREVLRPDDPLPRQVANARDRGRAQVSPFSRLARAGSFSAVPMPTPPEVGLLA